MGFPGSGFRGSGLKDREYPPAIRRAGLNGGFVFSSSIFRPAGKANKKKVALNL